MTDFDVDAAAARHRITRHPDGLACRVCGDLGWKPCDAVQLLAMIRELREENEAWKRRDEAWKARAVAEEWVRSASLRDDEGLSYGGSARSL